MLKTLFSVGTLAVAGALYFGKDKYDSYKQVADNLKVDFRNPHDFGFSKGDVTLKMDLQLSNPTPVSIDIPGKQLQLKNVRFYSPSGALLGEANPNISELTMPANGTRTITSIPIRIALANAFENLNDIIAIMQNTATLKMGIDLEAFGKSFTVQS